MVRPRSGMAAFSHRVLLYEKVPYWVWSFMFFNCQVEGQGSSKLLRIGWGPQNK